MNNLLRRDQKSLTLLAVIFCLGVRGHAAVPAPEKLLPDDTLLMVTAPDFLKIRQIYKSSPQSQLWNDPAMRPFKEKFLSKWNDDFVKPLERELNVHFADYSSLPQGQVTLAVTLNGNEAKDDQPPGLLLLVDTREKSSQLKTNLADLRKKWTDAGKSMKTEKLRNYDFSVLSLSSNDVPKTLRKVFPQRAQAQEASSEDESKKSETRTELIVGQAESLLIVCNSTKLVEKIVTHLAGGGTLPSLSDVAAYDANHQALFRASPAYGWVNTKAIVDIITKQASEKKEPDADDPLGNMNPGKIMAAIGLDRTKVYIANIVKCHPLMDPTQPEKRGNDRPPLPSEMEKCLPFLKEQIAILQPSLIVTLGSTATKALLGRSEGITKLRGQIFHADLVSGHPPFPVLPTYHPAFVLRDQRDAGGVPRQRTDADGIPGADQVEKRGAGGPRDPRLRVRWGRRLLELERRSEHDRPRRQNRRRREELLKRRAAAGRWVGKRGRRRQRADLPDPRRVG